MTQSSTGCVSFVRRLGEANVFCGDPKRQVSDAVSHGGDGRVVVIESLATALAALDGDRRPGRRHERH